MKYVELYYSDLSYQKSILNLDGVIFEFPMVLSFLGETYDIDFFKRNDDFSFGNPEIFFFGRKYDNRYNSENIKLDLDRFLSLVKDNGKTVWEYLK